MLKKHFILKKYNNNEQKLINSNHILSIKQLESLKASNLQLKQQIK